MSLETYPKDLLPLPSVSFNLDSNYSNIQSSMDSGRTRQRRRFSQEHEMASATFDLTRFQYAAWVAFWDIKINRGNDWFNMELPTPNGDRLTLSEVRFVGDYKAQHRANGNWDISVSLEYKDPDKAGLDYFDAFTIWEGDMDAFQADVALIWGEVEHYYVEHAHIEWYDITDFQNQVASLWELVEDYHDDYNVEI